MTSTLANWLGPTMICHISPLKNFHEDLVEHIPMMSLCGGEGQIGNSIRPIFDFQTCDACLIELDHLMECGLVGTYEAGPMVLARWLGNAVLGGQVQPRDSVNNVNEVESHSGEIFWVGYDSQRETGIYRVREWDWEPERITTPRMEQRRLWGR